VIQIEKSVPEPSLTDAADFSIITLGCVRNSSVSAVVLSLNVTGTVILDRSDPGLDPGSEAGDPA
jgi:hypothetical protein